MREIPPSYVASAGYNSKTGAPRDALLFGSRGEFFPFWNLSTIPSDPHVHFPEVGDGKGVCSNDVAPAPFVFSDRVGWS